MPCFQVCRTKAWTLDCEVCQTLRGIQGEGQPASGLAPQLPLPRPPALKSLVSTVLVNMPPRATWDPNTNILNKATSIQMKCWTLCKSSEGKGSSSRSGQVTRPGQTVHLAVPCAMWLSEFWGSACGMHVKENTTILTCGVSAFQTLWLCAPWSWERKKKNSLRLNLVFPNV